MAEKGLSDLPPAYSNLGFDAESEAGPSAPKDLDDHKPEDIPQESSYPSAPPPPPPEQNVGPPQMVYNPPSLVFEEIYDACVLYLKKHCCYGSRFINQMKLTEIHNKAVYHYKLESFGEKRQTVVREYPYKGGSVDGPDRGPSPAAWDMTVNPPHLFKDCKAERTVPHTESVHTCTRCDGSGSVTCSNCWGRGRVSCSSCSGSGKQGEETCSSCNGWKDQQCHYCSGSGSVTCSRCDGYGEMVYYNVLIVTWKNHVSNFVTSTDDMPNDLIIKSEGIVLHEYQNFTVPPILNAADETVNAASVALLENHLSAFPSEMIIRQRHTLRALPFTRVKYQWKEREGEFYVYATDRKVYFEEYPQRCCCCTCC